MLVAFQGVAVAYTVTGMLILYSGIKGSTISDTVRSVLTGNLDVSDTETVNFSGSGATGTGNTASTVTGGKASESASANQALAKSIIGQNPAYAGWDTGQNWTDLVSLWNRESGWSATADNSSSGAYGIAQALPAAKYPAAGQAPPTGTSDPGAQISWGLSYIQQRYGSPVMAWAYETSNNSY